MKLLSADLLNYCQFSYLKLNFTAGLTAIVGTNGSGKTNAINSIYTVLTGDFSRNAGVKIDNIRQQAGLEDPSRIMATLEHDGNHILISRGLRPTSVNLQITDINGGRRVITKVTEANEALYTILGVSPKMLADYVFVDQWAIFDFLSMQPSDRAKAFQRLFKTERAESIWKILGEHIDSLAISIKSTAAKQILEERMHDIISQIATKTQELNQLVSKLNSTDIRGLVYIVDTWDKKQSLLNEVNQIQTTCKVKEENMRVYSDKLKLLSTQTDMLSMRLTTMEVAYNQANSDKILLNGYKNTLKQHTQLIEKLAILSNNALTAPVRPDNCLDIDSIEFKQLNDSCHDLRKERVLCEDYDDKISSNAGTCPLCGSDVEKAFQHNKGHLATLNKLIEEHQEILLASTEYAHALRKYVNELTHREELRKELQAQLDNFDIISNKPKLSEDVIEKTIREYDKLYKELKPLKQQLHDQQVKYNELKSVSEYLTVQAKEKYDLYLHTDPSITDTDAERAKLLLDEIDSYNNIKTELETTIKLLQHDLTRDQSALAQLAQIEAKEQLNLKWADHCTAVRDILHRDNLPRLVALNYLELMQEEINDLLLRFESPFSIMASTDLSFTAHFKDGRKIPTGRLSGGEKVLLALAFRVVVNDIFAKDLGLLVLDEPTSGLDEGNLVCIRIAMARLKELSSSRGLQVVMVTHERDLINIFDNVIEIK